VKKLKFSRHKWIITASVATYTLIALLVISIVSYDILYFMPYRSDMKQLLSEANSENRHPPQIIFNLIDISNQNGMAVTASVARNLLTKYTKASQYRMIVWHANYLLWNWLVRVHLSKEELYAYYCLLSFNGKDYGANELSGRLFHKPLSKLNEQEAATVIATLIIPSQSKNNKKNIDIYKNFLLNKLSTR
jgi:hypothetical protein